MLTSPTAMHIPDGFLSPAVSIVLWIISIIVISYALKQTNRHISDRQLPLMGITAAAIFAGQMLNFSVTGGTSGHLMGAALATILLGPWAAIVVMTSVVSVQALVFQDGGLLALGANLFNMAIIGAAVAYTIYQPFQRMKNRSWGLYAGGIIAAWGSILAASLACALQLAFSGTSPANIAVPTMGGIHALIGIGEGLITAGALAFIHAARRDLLSPDTNSTFNSKPVIMGGLFIATLLALASPLASAHPDGLEWVAEQNGFIERARESIYNIAPDYILPGIRNETIATIAAGVIGLLIVFGAAYSTVFTRKRRKDYSAQM